MLNIKFTLFIFSAFFTFPCFLVIAKDRVVKPLSEAEATAIVVAQEKAKERAKDSREATLKSAEIIETSVANLDDRKVIFNRVKASKTPAKDQVNISVKSNEKAMVTEAFSQSLETKKRPVMLTLSGVVYDDTISEIWWDYEGQRYRIFSNANFLLFNGIGEFSDDEANYSVLIVVSSHNSDDLSNSNQWRPTTEDFSPDVLEYYVVEWGDGDSPDEEALKGILAMLKHYTLNHKTMQMAHENSTKMRDAKKAYRKANRPRKRNTIINFAPTGKSSDLYK